MIIYDILHTCVKLSNNEVNFKKQNKRESQRQDRWQRGARANGKCAIAISQATHHISHGGCSEEKSVCIVKIAELTKEVITDNELTTSKILPHVL